jgi:putative ABC transport system permease protein
MEKLFSSICRKAIKYRVYTIINIAGLSTAFALSSLLFLYSWNEYNVDSFHRNRDRIYRVVDSKDGCAFTQPLLAGELKDAFPEIEAVTRVRHNDGGYYRFGENTFDIQYDMCFDSTAFQIFDFHLIAGNEKEALKNPFSIVLTKSVAKRIFKEIDPIGQTLRYNNLCNFVVTGVMDDLPENSSFSVDAILPFPVLAYLWDGNPEKPSNVLTIRDNASFHTYILFKQNINVPAIESKITAFMKNKDYGQDFKLQSQKNIYFDKNARDRWINKGDASMVILLLSIAIGLLIISIVNYINLNSAITRNNLFNLGIRKLLGAKTNQIVTFSIVETLIFFSVSIALAALIIAFIKEPFQNILLVNYNFSSVSAGKLFFLVALLALAVALLSGVLPARYFIRVHSVAVINSKHSNKGYSNLTNNSLIILQFFITIVFIVAALTIEKQVYYINHKKLGFDKDLLVYVDMKSMNLTESQAKSLKEDLISDPRIQSVSYSAGLFGDVRRGDYAELNGIKALYRRIPTDPDYIKTMGYHIVEGRDFSSNMKTDFTSQAYIVNQATVKAFEMKDPLNEKINDHPIVGVVEDFNFESVHKNIQPVAFVCNPEEAIWIANIKLSSGDVKGAVQHIRNMFKKIKPDSPLHYSFADERIAGYYKKEIQFSKLSVIFSIINIIISCIGLVGLVLFRISCRVKEIGIRKVNGAKISEVMVMLNQDFVRWITIAFVIATPISWYAMDLWLKNFVYKTNLSWWIFALSGILTLGIALLTVSWQSWNAAARNPVESLRYE